MTCDANFNQIGLLCNFDGVNGATVAYDNSAFGLPLTRAGAAALSTTNPMFGVSCALFDGFASSYFSTPVVAGGPVDLSTGDFTAECWIRFDTVLFGGVTPIFGNYLPSTGWNVVLSAPGAHTVEFNAGAVGVSNTLGTPNDGLWHHVAVVRQGNNFDVFLDGISSGSVQTGSGSIGMQSTLYVGAAPGFAGAGWPGAIDEVRITKGFARYTPGSNFTPAVAAFPTMQCVTADADFPDVSLLLSMDGPDGATVFTDLSNSSLPIPSGANISTIKNLNTLFGSGVATFDNAGSSFEILIPIVASGPLDFTGVDFTIECWINQTVIGPTFAGIFGTLASGVGFFVGFNSAGLIQAQVEVSGVLTPLTGAGATVTAATWHAVALVRQGSTYTVYFDGVAALSLTAAGSDATSGNFTIGITPTFSPDSMTGSLDEFRVTKGLARYTGNYTPSSTQFGQDSAAPPADSDFANVSLLLNFDSYNNDDGTGGGFTDTSSVVNVMTAVGSAVVTTDNARFGLGSLLVNGFVDGANVDYISTPITTGGPLDLSTGDWTIEGWVNTGAAGGTSVQNFLEMGASFSGGQGLRLSLSAGSTFGFIVSISTGPTAGGSSGSVATGQWTHFALVASGGFLTMYGDGQGGTPQIQPIDPGTPAWSSIVRVGCARLGAAFSGQIDELRITKGIARYTSNFTPPLLPFGTGASTTTVPNVVGQLLATAETNIVAASLVVGAVTSGPSGSVPAGDVISTSPVAGTSVSIGSSVDILWSTGLPTVPNVVGESLTAATADIIAAGLTVGTATPVVDPAPPMQVLTQNPVGGTVSAGPVNLTYSEGVAVPDLTNTSVAVVAPGLLAAVGLILGAVTYHVSGVIIVGNIISQSPAASTFVAGGSAVAVVVSSGLPPLTVPDLFGLDQADAELALTSLGLVVGAVGSAPSQIVAPDTVQAQNPSAGTAVAVGSIVSFVLSLGTPVVGVMFDFEATVISQYANSPVILQLVQNMNFYVDQSANFANFFNFVWNVDTAVGFGLDIWGKIVGVSRLLHIPTTVDYVGFDNSNTPPPDWQPMGSDQPPQPAVGGAMYTGYNATQTYLLNDDAYRQLIFAKAFANIAATTALAINQILQNLYGPGTAFVLNEGPMQISYNLTFTPSAIQLAILEQSGVIPTPPGVLVVAINTNV